jgi:hypothetical protein
MDNMDKFEFLLGEWHLEYRVPKSTLSAARSDEGAGSFQRVLDGKDVSFDYSTKAGSRAHGIFAWDERAKVYRYWWFENSGNFLSATCNFLDNGMLAMNWHDSLLVQTFTRVYPERVVLKMQAPDTQGGYELVLEVIFTRREHGHGAVNPISPCETP